MDLVKVQEILKEVALKQSGNELDAKIALQKIAIALMHIAQGIQEIQKEQANAALRRP